MAAELVRVRASSLPELFDCAARWEGKHILNMHLPSSSAAQLGTAVHAGTAIFDQSIINADPLPIEDAEGVVVDAIWHPEYDVDWSDGSQKEAEPIARALYRKYCEELSPQFTFRAVEAECDRLDIPDLGISLTGTTDRVYEDAASGSLGIADIKTGKAAVAADGTVKTNGHAAQIAVYELLAEHAIGKPIDAPAHILGLQVAKTPAGRRAGVGTIEAAKDLLIGTDTQAGMLEMASRMIASGIFPPNPRSSLCSPKYCPRFSVCPYRR